VRVLLLTTLGAFLAQLLLGLMGLNLALLFGLSLSGLRHGMIWQPVTYMFMHGSLLHFLLNMLVLFFLGPETERAMGTRTFYRLYLGAGVIGGLGWLVISGTWSAVCVGASGAVLGVLAAFAALFPHRRITLLVFFILPVTMKAWVMAAMIGVLEVLFLLTGLQGGTVANAAHLAGGLAGYLYARSFVRRAAVAFAPPRRKPPSLSVLRGGRGSSEPSQEDVDRLLDKIARQGLDSLTPSERRILQKASERMRVRGR
jgi:membrane associated rhomboid family serine protease